MRKIFLLFIATLIIIAGLTYSEVQPLKRSLTSIVSDAQNLRVVDRNKQPLNISYQNRWNIYDNLPLYQIPDFLKQAFIYSEDRHFYQHPGIDWRALLSAIWQNLHVHHSLRGASTITAQVVRMIHPRRRTLWAKWLESFEALALDYHFSKADILEFYLNQLPYASNRRGVVQAAHYYFNRDLTNLTLKEMLALVVLARAPSSYDLYHNQSKINLAIARLADALYRNHQLSQTDLASLKHQHIELQRPQLAVNAAHFVNYVRTHLRNNNRIAQNYLPTTLDANLQNSVQAILDQRLHNLSARQVNNAAVLIVDHTNGEILAWVVAGTPAAQIDAVTVPRQPGSALKPFLYALALDLGWTAATLIDDSPLAQAIGHGVHNFKNYSNTFYGKISLREALANSLNIPALRTIQYVGVKNYLAILHRLGFSSLAKNYNFYDEGLALGNGEVTLFELTQAFTALANHGNFKPLKFLLDNDEPFFAKSVFSPAAASLIGNILSDPWARRLEFGYNSVLNLPVQTAIKTGTSTDYRDAWVVGYNYHYVVGIWMGNLDRSPMDNVTGSTGPALALRSIFAKLNQNQQTSSLFLSPKLIAMDVCKLNHEKQTCHHRTEYFMQAKQSTPAVKPSTAAPQIIMPTNNLQIALDPRIPRSKQKLGMQISGLTATEQVKWILNGRVLAISHHKQFLWTLQKGSYDLLALIYQKDKKTKSLAAVHFVVK